MAMQVRPLTGLLGAEISGIDLAKPLSGDEKRALYRLFVDHSVLVVRDQKFTPPDFANAVEIFGTIIPEQMDKYRLPDFPKVSYISNRDLETTGKKRAVRGEGFHTDHTNYLRPPKATVLYGIEIPKSGGDTEFVSSLAAYDDLDKDDKKRLNGLRAVHAFAGKWSDAKATVIPPEQVAKTQINAHPIARRHPENNRVGLYLCPQRVTGIEGMPDEDARTLLEKLYVHATQPKYLYRHKWRKGDMVIWDNRSVLHQATSDYDMTEYRYLYRVMVEGEVPLPVEAGA